MLDYPIVCKRDLTRWKQAANRQRRKIERRERAIDDGCERIAQAVLDLGYSFENAILPDGRIGLNDDLVANIILDIIHLLHRRFTEAEVDFCFRVVCTVGAMLEMERKKELVSELVDGRRIFHNPHKCGCAKCRVVVR